MDSFDSSDPVFSTSGQYDSTKLKANAIVATDASTPGVLNIGNGNIFGQIFTGPGIGQSAIQLGSNGSVGDAAWVYSNAGIQPGHWAGNFYINFPDVPTPTFAGLTLPPADTNGVITVNGGSFTATSDPVAGYNITGPTTLWVQGSFKPNGITIATTNNASLILYVGTADPNGTNSLSFQLGGTINQPGYAANLQCYCLPSVTNVTIGGNVGFVGTIYAPEAAATGGGGGNNTLDTSGAMVVKSFTSRGHWNFHYDEHLKTAGPMF